MLLAIFKRVHDAAPRVLTSMCARASLRLSRGQGFNAKQGLQMTTAHERERAQMQAREFLQELGNPELAMDVPERFKRRARMLLRHLAAPGEVRDALEVALRLFHAERERDELRTVATAVTWRVLWRSAVVIAMVLVVGMWFGSKVPH